MAKTAALIYSGGLDTTVCIPMLREFYSFENIITITVDVGQPLEDIRSAEARSRALHTKQITVDAKAEFAQDYCFNALKANANYQGYPLSTAIARPIIAIKAVEAANQFPEIEAFVHGCTGKGNDQFRIEFILSTLAPEIPIIAPMRERNMTRSEEIAYALERNIPIQQSIEKIWSVDENLWGRSIEGGRLEDPSCAPPEEIFQWTCDPIKAQETPEIVKLTFVNGNPTAINDAPLSPLELIIEMNKIAGRHGVGRVDIMEDRIIGLKVRENYECPAAVSLITAHKALEALVCTTEERAFKESVDAKWSDLAYAGLWLDPFKESLEAFINQIQTRVTGEVRLKFYKGSVIVIGRQSPFALYSESLASFDDSAFDQSEMSGMVKAHGIAAKIYSKLKN